LAFKIKVNTEEDYILVEHYGDTDLDENIQAGEKALRVAINNQIMNILVDVTGITGAVSIMDLFASTKHHAETAKIRPLTAIYGRQDQKRELEFMENVGVNRGMSIKIFTDKNEALDWLLRKNNQV